MQANERGELEARKEVRDTKGRMFRLKKGHYFTIEGTTYLVTAHWAGGITAKIKMFRGENITEGELEKKESQK